MIERRLALKIAEYAIAPITMATALMGCRAANAEQPRFNADSYKYRTVVQLAENPSSYGSLYLFSDDEPILTQSGDGRTVLRIHNAVCPTKGYANNQFERRDLESYGCQNGIYDYMTSTRYRITVVSTPKE